MTTPFWTSAFDFPSNNRAALRTMTLSAACAVIAQVAQTKIANTNRERAAKFILPYRNFDVQKQDCRCHPERKRGISQKVVDHTKCRLCDARFECEILSLRSG